MRIVNADFSPFVGGAANALTWSEEKSPVAAARTVEAAGVVAGAAGVAGIVVGAKRLLGRGAVAGGAVEEAGLVAARVAPRLLASTAARYALGAGAVALAPLELGPLAGAALGVGGYMLASYAIGKIAAAYQGNNKKHSDAAAPPLGAETVTGTIAPAQSLLRRHQSYLHAAGFDTAALSSTDLIRMNTPNRGEDSKPALVGSSQYTGSPLLSRNDPEQISFGLDAAPSRHVSSHENIFNITVGDILVSSQAADPAAVAQDVSRVFSSSLVASLDQFSHALIKQDNGGIY